MCLRMNNVELTTIEKPANNLGFRISNITESKSILVVSTNAFCERLKYALSKEASDRCKTIIVKLAESVDQILESGIPDSHVDYMVLAFDGTLRQNIDKMTNNLIRLESAFIASRMCLVNGSPKNGLPGSGFEIQALAEKYNLLYMNGQVMEEKCCVRLARRILDLANVVCGFETGMPIVLPTSLDVFRQLYM